MKMIAIKFISPAILLLSISIFVFGFKSYNDELRKGLLVKVISFAIESGHFDPAEFNDEFSKKAFESYINNLDYGKRFLTKEDVQTMSVYKYEIDESILNQSFEFFDFSYQLFDQRIKKSQLIYQEILSKPFDFDVSEFYEADWDKRNFAKDTEGLYDVWRRTLKYEAITRIYDKQKSQNAIAKSSDTVILKPFVEIEEEVRSNLLKRYDDWFYRLKQLDKNDWFDLYINSIVGVLDPHTKYFPPKDKEDFDIRFSGHFEGIGAILTQKNAFIEVTKIIPFSPSSKQGELEAGDFILSVAQENENPVDIVDMPLEDAVQLIRGRQGTKVTLTIKKPDGSINNISLMRDVIVLEETYAKSAIIQMDSLGNKIGYIKLPSFYADFTQINGKNCYEDVKSEISKLKKEQIEGIIFDIRDNGGGSLTEVVNIAGLFFELGPVVQTLGRNELIRPQNDLDPDTQYSGPLLVLVNKNSASASEIFAAAMQDYKRAIILGGEQTYGKGTVQRFVDLDQIVPEKPQNMQELGALKLTIQKYYRISGGSIQTKGVIPDVVIPDYLSFLDYGENKLDYAIPWDEIKPLNWNSWKPSFDKDFVVSKSIKRIRNNETIRLIAENGERLKEIRENSKIDLKYSVYKEVQSQRENEAQQYKDLTQINTDMLLNIPTSDLDLINTDTSRKERTIVWFSELKKDIYIEESLNILHDIIANKEKHASNQNHQ